MSNLDKQYLIAIKSIVELKTTSFDLSFLLSKLTDKQFAYKIANETKLMNYGKVISIIDNYLFEKILDPVLFDMSDIKKFDFDIITQETMTVIKEKIGVEKTYLKTVKDKHGSNTSSLRHWDNINRFAIIVNKDLLNSVIQNPQLLLCADKQISLGTLGYYTKFTIKKCTDFTKVHNHNYNHYYDRNNWLADASGTDDLEVMNDVYWNLD